MAVALLAASLAAPAQSATDGASLPALGEAASAGLSASQERQIGDEVMVQIRRDPDYLDDPVLLAYVDSLWQPLLAAARQRGDIASDQAAHAAWEVFLVRDRAVNAFALPGGYVGVHLGLIGVTVSRDELAAVLAHELSHVTQRHIARQLGNQSRQSMVGLATMVLGVLAASRNPTAANALIVGGQAAAVQGQLNFSRDMEREADRVGYGVLAGAGYGPGGMADMFDKMEQGSRLNDDQSVPWLRTHPLTTERIAEAKNRARGARAVASGGLLYAVMQGRAQVLMDTRAQALTRLAAARAGSAAPVGQRLGTAVAAALAANRLKDGPRADAAWALARSLSAGDAEAAHAVAALGVEMWAERGDAKRSAEALKPWREQGGDDGSRAALWLSARVALLGGADDQRRSAEALQAWVSDHPRDATMWSTLGQVATRLGQTLRAVRAEAEARWALGDTGGAVDRLRSGQRLARAQPGSDTIDAAVINARLLELEAQLRRDQMGKRAGGPGG